MRGALTFDHAVKPRRRGKQALIRLPAGVDRAHGDIFYPTSNGQTSLYLPSCASTETWLCDRYRTLRCSWPASSRSERSANRKVGGRLEEDVGATHVTLILQHCPPDLETLSMNCNRFIHTGLCFHPTAGHRARRHSVNTVSLLNVRPERGTRWITVTLQSATLTLLTMVHLIPSYRQTFKPVSKPAGRISKT